MGNGMCELGMDRYKGISEILFVSCATGDGIPKLKEELEKVASRINLLVSANWIMLLEKLRNKRQKKVDYITFKNLKKSAKNCLIHADELPIVVDFLKDTGSIIHFSDSYAKLNEIVILNPQWLADIMACFVSFQNSWHKQGMIKRKDVPHILKPYPHHLHDLFLILLEKFNIIKRLNHTNDDSNYEDIIIPCLLHEAPPDNFYQPENDGYWSNKVPENTIEHCRIYQWNFMPLGFFDRLLIATFYLSEPVDHIYYWRYGHLISLRSDPNQATLVTFSHNINPTTAQPLYTLKIRSRIPKSKFLRVAVENKLFNLVIQLIEHILSCYYRRLEDLTRRYIPCVHCLENQSQFIDPYLFYLEDAITSISEGQHVLYCRGIKSVERSVLICFVAPDLTFKGMNIIDSDLLQDLLYITSGGFGKVWKATFDSQYVAVKEMLGNDVINQYSEFRKEVQMMRFFYIFFFFHFLISSF